jgi:protein involved in temperature-dependent protein secretion
MSERERRRRVVEFLRSGQAEEAAGELAASREPYPGDGMLHHAIGLAFASRGTLGLALEQLEAAARLDPRSPEILTDLAQVLLAQGRADSAVELAEQAAALSPKLAIARFTLGRAYLVTECARQGRRPPPPEPGKRFSLVDGRSPTYLRALEEMEAALEASPPFIGAVREALALAYQRAGHYHAAAQQLRAQMSELGLGQKAQEVQARLQDVENEIAREQYWEIQPGDLTGAVKAARAVDASPEAKLRLAHVRAALGREEEVAEALHEARAAGYQPREAAITHITGEARSYQQVADVDLLLTGGLECVAEGRLRFLPFSSIRSITLDQPRLWRGARVELADGVQLVAAVPSLYRLSLRSPSDLIQSGRFTQFNYGPGETRYAYAIGARNLITASGVVPFGEIDSIVF